jgi:hypothetical protein
VLYALIRYDNGVDSRVIRPYMVIRGDSVCAIVRITHLGEGCLPLALNGRVSRPRAVALYAGQPPDGQDILPLKLDSDAAVAVVELDIRPSLSALGDCIGCHVPGIERRAGTVRVHTLAHKAHISTALEALATRGVVEAAPSRGRRGTT